MTERDPIRFAEDATPRSRWRARLTFLAWNAATTLGVLLLALLVYGSWLTYVRAEQGAAAFRFLEQQVQQQQRSAAPPVSPAEPAK